MIKQAMLLALDEAKKGLGKVSPNPMVGAVLLKNGKIIGKAHHHEFGKPHAEALLLGSLPADEAKDATLVVNLEPCSHFGKTPPCSDLIVKKGIKRVVIATRDPNPLVSGKGIKFLMNHGIRVDEGICRERAIELNLGFFMTHLVGRPFITIKYAQSLDGRIGISGKKRFWISNSKSQLHSHELRVYHNAILVGIETVLSDDPLLNVRYIKGISPRKVILDSNLRIPFDARLIHDDAKRVIIFSSAKANQARAEELRKMNVEVETVEEDRGRLNLFQVMKSLKEMGVNSVLVEGGSNIITSFLENGLYDDLKICIAPKILGRGIIAIGEIHKWRVQNNDNQIKLLNIKKVEEDVWLRYRSMQTIINLRKI